MKEKMTYAEIEEMFRSDDRFDEEFKSIILQRIASSFQVMYNLMQSGGPMQMHDTHGDFFQEEHNRFVTEYQHYHN